MPRTKKKKRLYVQRNQEAKKKQTQLEEQMDFDSSIDVLSPFSTLGIETTIQMLRILIDEPDLYFDPKLKLLRKTLFELSASGVMFNEDLKVKSLSNQVTDALEVKNWEKALVCLKLMRENDLVPKLGALQRWVRFCDAAGVDDEQALIVLDSMLRTVNPEMVEDVDGSVREGRINKFPEWEAFPLGDFEFPQITEESKSKWKNALEVCYQVKGELRNPPNLYDLVIYKSQPGIIDFTNQTPISKIDCPNVPGAFMIRNVLDFNECRQFLIAAESIGFLPDEPIVDGNNSILAHNVVWLVDDMINNIIYHRCKEFLPQEIMGGDICGINRRWRIYRYVPGALYRPHIDGGWPASGLDEHGGYLYDAKGDAWSRLTFLLYLNEGFKGGCTTYFTPSTEEGIMNGFPVAPRAGSVMIFPHGNSIGSLLHEGSGVEEGAKYIVRTEVLYKADHIHRGMTIEPDVADTTAPKKRKRSKREVVTLRKQMQTN